MKINFVTIGKPKLQYATIGWNEYLRRLEYFHKVTVSQLHDKYANDVSKILEASANSYRVALVIGGKQLDSPALAEFLRQQELVAQHISFIIGGPEGLPQGVIDAVDFQWSLSDLTFPHDLAMVVTLEALYRASTITAGQPYHK
jgi:23S rRNA (pseudouridine1915-N3)-methyltransferase